MSMDKYKITDKGKETKYIKCMNYEECKNKFESEGSQHRLCNQCRKKSFG